MKTMRGRISVAVAAIIVISVAVLFYRKQARSLDDNYRNFVRLRMRISIYVTEHGRYPSSLSEVVSSTRPIDAKIPIEAVVFFGAQVANEKSSPETVIGYWDVPGAPETFVYLHDGSAVVTSDLDLPSLAKCQKVETRLLFNNGRREYVAVESATSMPAESD